MFLGWMASSSLLCMVHASSRMEVDENPEQLFRRTVAQWRSQRNVWIPWMEFTQEILHRFDDAAAADKRLELVGALEEGILAVERATMNEGENGIRDAAISQLYAAYGKTLMELNPNECLDLAMDPHTLLIGAETLATAATRQIQGQGDEFELLTNDLCVENAENALRNAVTLDATNSVAEQLLETITGANSDNAVHKRKPKEFVAELFDSFADTFDEKLLDGLGYKVPKLVGDVAKHLLQQQQQQQQQDHSSGAKYSAVLDAGCGTGLAGRFLRPLIATPSNTNSQDDGGVMIGVDASQKMLDIAAKCTTHSGCGLKQNNNDGIEINANGETDMALYDNLLVLDLEEMTVENTLGSMDAFRNTNEEQGGFDLIVAADVLVYFGNLETLLATFAKVSRPGASLVFSCERATQDEAPLGWRLLSSGRFAHTKLHAVETASQFGYELLSYQEIVPRMEKGEEVRGHLFGFRLATTMRHPTAEGQHKNGEL
eukprot:CAMPEP_0198294880 /NCGR_PEP_ID=MMETSP1449-20131203/24696_1 /TAXON_ID=420275 /ORGANISM="Attheya septentrionalis, Strain CCMP2084" /LENGTH=487 /DNA_ID=CAMNT_0043994975 /DNA_START=86 /DNA_END=1549 /DNA_ORIENTATION=+